MILPISKKHISTVYQLCNTAFGDNYIALYYLHSYLHNEHKKGFVLIENNFLIGFILMSFHTPSDLRQEVICKNEWFYHEFRNSNRIGIIQQVIVHPDFQREGRAERLIRNSIDTFKNNTDLFLCNAWVINSIAPLAIALTKNNFLLRKTILNYWSADSLSKNYLCKICGYPPCTCSAKIYSLVLREKFIPEKQTNTEDVKSYLSKTYQTKPDSAYKKRIESSQLVFKTDN